MFAMTEVIGELTRYSYYYSGNMLVNKVYYMVYLGSLRIWILSLSVDYFREINHRLFIFISRMIDTINSLCDSQRRPTVSQIKDTLVNFSTPKEVL